MNLRHRHWKAFDDHIVVERLQNVTRHQRMINAGIFVWMEASEVLLANIDHFGLNARLHELGGGRKGGQLEKDKDKD